VGAFLRPEADGIECQKSASDYPKVIERKNGIVSKHSKGVEFLMKKNKIEWIKGFATIKGAGKIEVQAKKALDSGSQTHYRHRIGSADASGLAAARRSIFSPTSRSSTFTEVPIAGDYRGGAVGVEFASIFHRFGSKVTLLECCRALCLWKVKRCRRSFTAPSRKRGSHRDGRKGGELRKTGKGVAAHRQLDGGKKESWKPTKLLVAVGRSRSPMALDWNPTRVELDRGFIKVNERQQTAEPGIYVIGDVWQAPATGARGTREGMVRWRTLREARPSL